MTEKHILINLGEKMTEKRFKNIGCDIFQYGEWWCSANGEHCADVIATAMNELLEENEQLKQQHRQLQIDFNDACIITHKLKEKVLDLEDENEELKQQKTELLRLIDNNIEIYENINTNGDYQGEIQGKLTVLNNLREVILK